MAYTFEKDLVDWWMDWIDANTDYGDRDIALQVGPLVFGAVHTSTQVNILSKLIFSEVLVAKIL